MWTQLITPGNTQNNPPFSIIHSCKVCFLFQGFILLFIIDQSNSVVEVHHTREYSEAMSISLVWSTYTSQLIMNPCPCSIDLPTLICMHATWISNDNRFMSMNHFTSRLACRCDKRQIRQMPTRYGRAVGDNGIDPHQTQNYMTNSPKLEPTSNPTYSTY